MKDDDLKKKGGEITRRLIGRYGTFKGRKRTPFAVLINTILSQNTSDKNSDVAFERLFSVYDTPEKLANAPEDKIKELIRIGGLYEIKAKRIKDISRLIIDEYGGSIDFVCVATPEAARKELLGIKGVGPKTADCVLIFACGRDLIPVDTHIFRVARRLGMAPEKADHERVRSALMEIVPPGERVSFHVAMIRFGREICTAQNPKHDRCLLIDVCDYAKKAGIYPPKKIP